MVMPTIEQARGTVVYPHLARRILLEPVLLRAPLICSTTAVDMKMQATGPLALRMLKIAMTTTSTISSPHRTITNNLLLRSHLRIGPRRRRSRWVTADETKG